MGTYSFPKVERLSREKLIKELFEKGSSFNAFPLKVVFMPHPDQDPPATQVLFTVSKRLFSRAVDRNAIKRRLREAYRVTRPQPVASKKWLIAYIYIAREILPSTVFLETVANSWGTISAKKYEKK